MRLGFRLLSTMLLLAAAPLHAVAAPAQTPDSYTSAAERVALPDGRTLNLRCSGSGPRTVVLEAGANADSLTWYRVQPLLAAHARVCSYDRAGYGFSEPGPLPRDLDADAADLAALITAARLSTPLVLVGHSLGSNIVRRHAQRHPQQVAGLVLVDPPEQGAQLPADWKRQDAALRARRDGFLTTCADAAAAGTLAAGDGPLAGCLRPPPPWQSPAVATATRASKLTPGYWRTLRSELDANVGLFAMAVPEDERHGDLPVRMLTADNPFDGAPEPVRVAMQSALAQTRARLLASSTRARQIAVPASSHDIQLDQPQIVADAVIEILDMTPPR